MQQWRGMLYCTGCTRQWQKNNSFRRSRLENWDSWDHTADLKWPGLKIRQMQGVEFHLLYQHLWERGNKINNKAEKEKKFFLKIMKSNTKLSKKKRWSWEDYSNAWSRKGTNVSRSARKDILGSDSDIIYVGEMDEYLVWEQFKQSNKSQINFSV